MYRITVEGEYITAGKFKQIEWYEEIFEIVTGEEGNARAIIQNGLITDRLRRTHKNFGRWRTCQVSSIEKMSEKDTGKVITDLVDAAQEPKEVSELQQLIAEASNLGCMPANYSSYKSNKVRKTQLKNALTAKKARIEKAARKLKPKGEGEWVD